MRNLIKSIAGHISVSNNYTKEEEEKVEYALRVFIFEALKIVGALVIFSILGYSLRATITIMTMAIIKPHIGGYHEDTQIKCFVATLIIIGSILYLSINLNMDFVSKLILVGISFYCIWHQAPVINSNMALTNPELIKRNRTIGILITILFTLVSIIFHKNTLISNTILWTIVFQALLMFNKR
ncbi:hypothetical protein GCM10008905_22520 [Clostridium malenominatum]|uniref:Accessory gene regulator B n=1 Tax=Clostridium malenominatum TaxID=1539 RepID=A0ABP3U7T5_9CLOT